MPMPAPRTAPAVRTEDQLADVLRGRGQRVTSQRLVIHRALRELDRHATAEQVLDAVRDRLPGISLPTVYATLELFEELEVVRRVSRSPGPVLYDPRTDPHHHLVCDQCGRVEDLDTSLDLAPATRAARRRGWVAEHTEVVVTGRCAGCAAA